MENLSEESIFKKVLFVRATDNSKLTPELIKFKKSIMLKDADNDYDPLLEFMKFKRGI